MENEKHIKNWINYKQLYAYRPLNLVFYTNMFVYAPFYI